MTTHPTEDINRWNRTSWLWVLLCAVGIFSTIPLARRIQKFIYDAFGLNFFMYFVLAVIACALALLLYIFVFRLKIRSISQYFWLLVCGGLYIYFTVKLREIPEEAVHLIEYGLLSYFVFKAVSHRIRDWTVYVTTVFIVLFLGIADEFIQWITPGRYWGIRDVWINLLASLIFIMAVRKGIRPKAVCNPVRKFSITTLNRIIMLNLLFLGLCLSNTPDNVNRYTSVFSSLSWLRNEEPMMEYGYEYHDPEIGTFCSRFTTDELSGIDIRTGEAFGETTAGEKELYNIYGKITPNTNPFLYEFFIHVSRRNHKFEELAEAENTESRREMSSIVYRESLILSRYFKNTLKQSQLQWPNKKIEDLKVTASLWKGDYSSHAGEIITSFSLETAWTVILLSLIIVRGGAEFWKKRIDA